MTEANAGKPTLLESVQELLANPDLERRMVPTELLKEYDIFHPRNLRVKAGEGVVATVHTGLGNEFDLGPSLGSGEVWTGGDRYDRVIIFGNNGYGGQYAQFDSEGNVICVPRDGSFKTTEKLSVEELEDTTLKVGAVFLRGGIMIPIEKIVAIKAKAGSTEGLPTDNTLQEFEEIRDGIENSNLEAVYFGESG